MGKEVEEDERGELGGTYTVSGLFSLRLQMATSSWRPSLPCTNMHETSSLPLLRCVCVYVAIGNLGS